MGDAGNGELEVSPGGGVAPASQGGSVIWLKTGSRFGD